ncbi:MAG: tyrosine-type recombinase/integrase [Bacteroidetes bacterium]|nr:tyrosine-type recombinase/integrase [Bacteroidota bacterium]
MTFIRIKYYLEHRKDANGKVIDKNVPLLFSASFCGRYKSTTGIHLDTRQWNGSSIIAHPRAEILNFQLRNIRKKLEKLYDDAIRNDIPLTVEYFKQGLRNRSTGDFFSLMEDFINEGKKKWQPGTVVKFTTLKNHLQRFSEKKRFKVEFGQLDQAFFDNLMDYYFEDEQTQYINSYVRKNIQFLQQFLKWATDKGYNKNMAFLKWKLETGNKRENTDGNITSLSIAEFLNFYDLRPKSEADQRTRDYLIFACSTGLRYSDIANLKKTDIDYKGGLISCITIKTGDRTVIPFNDFSKEILLKYNNTPNYNKQGIEMAFPAISNQKTNKALKTLAKEAGLTQMVPIVHFRRNKRIDEVVPKYSLIGTHIGRKTFITFAVWLGIPEKVTMKFTTHHNHETMEKYYDSKDESSLRHEMAKLNIKELRKRVKEMN